MTGSVVIGTAVGAHPSGTRRIVGDHCAAALALPATRARTFAGYDAVSLGALFWFDALSRLGSPRNAGPNPPPHGRRTACSYEYH